MMDEFTLNAIIPSPPHRCRQYLDQECTARLQEYGLVLVCYIVECMVSIIKVNDGIITYLWVS